MSPGWPALFLPRTPLQVLQPLWASPLLPGARQRPLRPRVPGRAHWLKGTNVSTGKASHTRHLTCRLGRHFVHHSMVFERSICPSTLVA